MATLPPADPRTCISELGMQRLLSQLTAAAAPAAGGVDAVLTVDGSDYVTLACLDEEVLAAIARHGRASQKELHIVTGVELAQVERSVKRVVAASASSRGASGGILVAPGGGDAMTVAYLDDVAARVRESLELNGIVSLAATAESLQLPLEFLAPAVRSRLQPSAPSDPALTTSSSGSNEEGTIIGSGNVLLTPAYARRQQRAARGALCGLTRPTSLAALGAQLTSPAVPSGTAGGALTTLTPGPHTAAAAAVLTPGAHPLYTVLPDIVVTPGAALAAAAFDASQLEAFARAAAKETVALSFGSSVKGGTYVPGVYLSAQRNTAAAFLSSNGYLSLQRARVQLGMPDPLTVLRPSFPSLSLLSGCVALPGVLLAPLLASVEDALGACSWVDSHAGMLPDCITSADMHALLRVDWERGSDDEGGPGDGGAREPGDGGAGEPGDGGDGESRSTGAGMVVSADAWRASTVALASTAGGGGPIAGRAGKQQQAAAAPGIGWHGPGSSSRPAAPPVSGAAADASQPDAGAAEPTGAAGASSCLQTLEALARAGAAAAPSPPASHGTAGSGHAGGSAPAPTAVAVLLLERYIVSSALLLCLVGAAAGRALAEYRGGMEAASRETREARLALQSAPRGLPADGSGGIEPTSKQATKSAAAALKLRLRKIGGVSLPHAPNLQAALRSSPLGTAHNPSGDMLVSRGDLVAAMGQLVESVVLPLAAEAAASLRAAIDAMPSELASVTPAVGEGLAAPSSAAALAADDNDLGGDVAGPDRAAAPGTYAAAAPGNHTAAAPGTHAAAAPGTHAAAAPGTHAAWSDEGDGVAPSRHPTSGALLHPTTGGVRANIAAPASAPAAAPATSTDAPFVAWRAPDNSSHRRLLTALDGAFCDAFSRLALCLRGIEALTTLPPSDVPGWPALEDAGGDRDVAEEALRAAAVGEAVIRVLGVVLAASAVRVGAPVPSPLALELLQLGRGAGSAGNTRAGSGASPLPGGGSGSSSSGLSLSVEGRLADLLFPSPNSATAPGGVAPFALARTMVRRITREAAATAGGGGLQGVGGRAAASPSSGAAAPPPRSGFKKGGRRGGAAPADDETGDEGSGGGVSSAAAFDVRALGAVFDACCPVTSAPTRADGSEGGAVVLGEVIKAAGAWAAAAGVPAPPLDRKTERAGSHASRVAHLQEAAVLWKAAATAEAPGSLLAAATASVTRACAAAFEEKHKVVLELPAAVDSSTALSLLRVLLHRAAVALPPASNSLAAEFLRCLPAHCDGASGAAAEGEEKRTGKGVDAATGGAGGSGMMQPEVVAALLAALGVGGRGEIGRA